MVDRRLLARSGGLFLALLMVCAMGAEQRPGFRFLATGDVPYFPAAHRAYKELLEVAEAQSPAFVAHIGDIKSAGTPCSDEAYESVRALFRGQPVPVVYTPGDNEWTDCHDKAAGSYDPIERLARLRQMFFDDPRVLRLDGLGVEHQAAPFVENYRFLHGGVMFAAVHVVGSKNNRRPKDPPSMAEFRARDAANQQFLEDAFRIGRERGAQAVVVLFHADPDFERSKPKAGYRSTLATLRSLVDETAVPILLIHGDSHEKRIDHPFKDARGKPIKRFTRLEVPGAPQVKGVMVGFHPGAKSQFTFDDLSHPDGDYWFW